jgi:CheY-like chemotaxis protein
VHVFDDEKIFINHLLTIQESGPDYISVVSTVDGYSKFDALIYYLKTLQNFEKTIFIAENFRQHISLNYFDEINEYFSPIDVYALKKSQDVKKLESKVNISILAIDDTETNLDILSLFISKKYPNITLDMASGGYEGIGMFKIKHYDMVMLDLKMPGLDGFEVFKKLKDLGLPLPPVYAFSADIYKSNIEKVEEYGFAGMIEKPLQPQKLYKIIERIMNEADSE